jgi:hypothetical protein
MMILIPSDNPFQAAARLPESLDVARLTHPDDVGSLPRRPTTEHLPSRHEA